MEFEDVKSIINRVVVKIRDHIDIEELVPYLNVDHFSTSTSQQIGCQLKQSGPVIASSEFFESLKRKPKSFITLVAAVKKIGQDEVYKALIDETRNHYKDQVKLAKVLSLIDAEEKRFGVTQENRTGYGTCDLDFSPNHYGDNSEVQGQGACGHDRPRSQQQTYSVENRFAGEPIESLHYGVYDKLAQDLGQPSPRSQEPCWKYALKQDPKLKITKKEVDEIGRASNPGEAFMEKLNERGYTLGDLEAMFETTGMTTAHGHLRQNQANVVPSEIHSGNQQETVYKQDLSQFDANNLNIAKERSMKDTQVKVIPSSPSTQSQINQGNNNQPPEHIQPLQPSSGSYNIQGSQPQHNIPRNIEPNNRSKPSENDDNSILSSIEDPPMKATQALPVVQDPRGELATKNVGQDADVLRTVRQENTEVCGESLSSFVDLTKTDTQSQSEGIALTTETVNLSPDLNRNLENPALLAGVANINIGGLTGSQTGLVRRENDNSIEPVNRPASNSSQSKSMTVCKDTAETMLDPATMATFSDIHEKGEPTSVREQSEGAEEIQGVDSEVDVNKASGESEEETGNRLSTASDTDNTNIQ